MKTAIDGFKVYVISLKTDGWQDDIEDFELFFFKSGFCDTCRAGDAYYTNVEFTRALDGVQVGDRFCGMVIYHESCRDDDDEEEGRIIATLYRQEAIEEFLDDANLPTSYLEHMKDDRDDRAVRIPR